MQITFMRIRSMHSTNYWRHKIYTAFTHNMDTLNMGSMTSITALGSGFTIGGGLVADDLREHHLSGQSLWSPSSE